MEIKSKITFMFLVLLYFQPLQAEELYEAKYPAMTAWDMGFKTHLLNHEDPELQVYGLSMLSPGLQTSDPSDPLVEQINKQVEQLSQQGLSPQAFVLLESVCQNQLLASRCDRVALMERQMAEYPDDMFSYFSPLSAAMNQGIEGEAIDLVRQMASTHHYTLTMHYGQVLEDELQAYVKVNPFSEAMLEEGLDDQMTWFYKEEELSEQQLSEIRKQMPEDMVLMRQISFDMAMPIHPFKGLLDACKQYPELESECLVISEKLIQHSGEYIARMIGLNIAENIYEARGDITRHEQALNNKAALHAEIKCLGQLVNVKNVFGEHANDMSERVRIAREKGDRAGMIHHANLLHQRAIQQGDYNVESLNPELCLTD